MRQCNFEDTESEIIPVPNTYLSNMLDKLNLKSKLIIAHININHVINKFDPLVSIIRDKIHILLISETKLDDSFPNSQFYIEGYKLPFRKDRNRFGGGLLFYVKNENICKGVKTELPMSVECMFIEVILNKVKYIIVGGYNPHKENISYFLNQISNQLDKMLVSYDNILLLGDLNALESDNSMIAFKEMYNLKNLIKVPTCFKNPLNPTSIDVMLTNKKENFMHSLALETGLSDHHKMTLAVLKSTFVKQKPIKLNYRSYTKFDENMFKDDLLSSLNSVNCESCLTYDIFRNVYMKVLNKHAPEKQKTLRGNHQPFMNKKLSKAFMHRSKLKNIYNKFPSDANLLNYKKQRNFCTNLLRREKNFL